MAGARIEINDDAALAKLHEAHIGLENPTELYEAIGKAMVSSTQRRFEEGVEPSGNPWPASLRAQFEGGKTLVDKGPLVGSITHIADANGVEVGTNMIYAATHQFGATITPKTAGALRFSIPGIGFITSQSVTIPARPFIGLSEEDETKIEDIANDFLSQALGGLSNAG